MTASEISEYRTAETPTLTECGRICAVAGRLQRDMRAWAAAYPSLFSAKPFDPALFSTLSLASAFSGPWLSAEDLRMANRTCLWCFALDWLVDYAASSRREVTAILRRCADVAEGDPPEAGDELTLFLADIRDELAAAATFPVLGEMWRDELRRTLTAMGREWDWKAAGIRPSFEEYLANADNLGFSFVFASHWIATGDGGAGDVARVREASHAVQRVIRLLNDLATYERDRHWGDLNALMTGLTREELTRRVIELTGHCRDLLRPLMETHPRLARYMERQMDFCAGFYELSDYWGAL